jgi:UDP-2,3-diacylglucosamine pyrophosphatase LpxH
MMVDTRRDLADTTLKEKELRKELQLKINNECGVYDRFSIRSIDRDKMRVIVSGHDHRPIDMDKIMKLKCDLGAAKLYFEYNSSAPFFIFEWGDEIEE